MKQKILFLTTVLLMVMSCKNQQLHNVSPKSESYIEEVIQLLKTHSVNKNKIDWDRFRNEVYLYANNSHTVADTYPAITHAITLLEDNHSYFSAANEKNPDEEKPLPVYTDEVVPNAIGYIRIPFCIGGEKEIEHYIETITTKIALQNTQAKEGWIVDLRENFGGNMWPMLVAVGPLLDNGVQGYFFDPNDKPTPWIYNNGKAFGDQELLAENKNKILLKTKAVKIAVLTNNRTASSGEAMTVVFRGLPNVKSFGEPTFGVSTGCQSFTLSDGSRINLATTVFADRNKQKYGKSIIPDVVCKSDEALDKAIKWFGE